MSIVDTQRYLAEGYVPFEEFRRIVALEALAMLNELVKRDADGEEAIQIERTFDRTHLMKDGERVPLSDLQRIFYDAVGPLLRSYSANAKAYADYLGADTLTNNTMHIMCYRISL